MTSRVTPGSDGACNQTSDTPGVMEQPPYLEAESLAHARESDRIGWMENHDAILREMSLVRERLSVVREEHRANVEEMEHAQRRAAAAQDESRAANSERDVERDSRLRLETELARARRDGAAANARAATGHGHASEAAMLINAENAALAAHRNTRNSSGGGDGGGGDSQAYRDVKRELAGLPLFTHVILQSKHQLMTASMLPIM
jgi:hypothetical protein